MAQCYDRFDVHFEYPPDWRVEEEVSPEFVSVSVQSPGSAFLTLVVFDSPQDQRALVRQAVDAIRDEFTDIDQRRAWQTLSGHRATGHDLSFYSMDLTNACAIRSFSTDARTFLVMYQATDCDLADMQPGFDQICRSLRVER